MKQVSKILAAVLVLCISLTTFGYAATYTDVADTSSYYSAVSLLSSLGIIKGYEDGSFGPEKNVTRAEFTVMLMRTLGKSSLGSSDPAGLPFSDVASVDWAVSDIRTAYDLKIINGMSETQFAPEEQVTSEQALKMIVCALGYEPMAVEIAGGKDKVWPSGYTSVAARLAITTGVTSAYTAPAKRWEIARYIFNCLETDLMETTEFPNGAVKTEIKTGKNILNDMLKIYYGTGELRSDSENSAEESGSLSREGELLIYEADTASKEVFYSNGISTAGLVGRNIKYYYTENNSGDKTLVHIEDRTKNGAVLSIAPDDIDGITGSWSSGVSIFYWDTDSARSTTEVKIGSNPTVSINGRVVNSDSITPVQALEIDSGSIELLDTENKGEYNKINIISYQTYAVKSINTTTKEIIDLYRTAAQGNALKLDADDASVSLSIVKAGTNSAMTLSSIAVNNILSVKQSSGNSGKTVIEVIVSNETVSGEISMVDMVSKKIEVDGKEYTLSNYLINYCSTLNTMAIGDTCKFYLDKDGNISSFEETTSTNTSYAYLCGVASENDSTIFKFIETNNARTSPKGASKVKIDGKSFSDPDDIVSTLTSISTGVAANNIDGKAKNGSQLVKITKNSSGMITAIDTIATAAEGTESDSNLKLSLKGSKFTYNTTGNQFRNPDNSSESFIIDSKTIIYAVPSDRSSFSDYTKKTLSSLKNGNEYTDIEVYDVTEQTAGGLKTAKCIVMYGSSSNDKLMADSPVLVASTVTQTTDSDGDRVHEIEGYLFGQTESNSTEMNSHKTTNDTTFSEALRGDVYQIAYYNGTQFNGYSKKLLSVTGAMADGFFNEQSLNKSDYVTAHGLLESSSTSVFQLAITNDVEKIARGTAEIQTFEATPETIFIKYDASQSDANKLTAMTNLDMVSLVSYNNTGSSVEIVKDENDNITEVNGLDKVSATELFVYVVDDKAVLVYQIVR